MVTAEMYKNYLSSYGSNLAQVKKNQSDAIMNNSFTADAQYKRVYILNIIYSIECIMFKRKWK